MIDDHDGIEAAVGWSRRCDGLARA
eukprot:COSAG02_NODE_62658_length_265_cov_0.626506_1_plen_24_part_01